MQRVRKQIGCESEIAGKYTGRNVTVAVLDTGERVILMSNR